MREVVEEKVVEEMAQSSKEGEAAGIFIFRGLKGWAFRGDLGAINKIFISLMLTYQNEVYSLNLSVLGYG